MTVRDPGLVLAGGLLAVVVVISILSFVPHGGGLGEAGVAALVVLFQLAHWGALLAVVVLLVRILQRAPATKREPPDTALDILERRYAGGELTRDEYLVMRADLGG